jgi:plastocyanin
MKRYKSIAAMMLLVVVLGTLLVACNGSSSNQVHMNETNFEQTSITVNKGENVTFVNDSDVIHAIDYGRWLDTTQIPDTEIGAPDIGAASSMNPNATVVIGPFNKTGTFHYYCTVHPGMNLTVLVK